MGILLGSWTEGVGGVVSRGVKGEGIELNLLDLFEWCVMDIMDVYELNDPEFHHLANYFLESLHECKPSCLQVVVLVPSAELGLHRLLTLLDEAYH